MEVAIARYFDTSEPQVARAQALVARLRREATNLREMSTWPGFDRERASRLINALYLQAALIVSRSAMPEEKRASRSASSSEPAWAARRASGTSAASAARDCALNPSSVASPLDVSDSCT